MGEQSPPEDIDPALLRETGRASAIQDLADQAKRMGDRAEAWEKTTREELILQIKKDRRSKRWLALALAVLALGIYDGRQTAIDTHDISEANAEILADLDTLVEFVDEVEQNRDDGPSPETAEVFKAAVETRDLVCLIQDPAVQARCAELAAQG